jgi:Bacteriophage CI repressor helix-turn-helix domain.
MEDANTTRLLSRMQQATNTSNDSSLAQALELSPQSVSDARRKNKVPPAWAINIAKKYQVSLDWLFFGIGTMEIMEAEPGQQVGCAQCVKLYGKLDSLHERLHSAMEENGNLREETGKLKTELAILKNGQSTTDEPVANAS